MNTSTFRSLLYLHLSRRSFSVGESILALLASASIGLAQGSLTPPGPPAPTMKTLEQLEPRIDLLNAPAEAVTTTDGSFNYVITQRGSYYLSGNVNVTKANGIAVRAAGVILDLNGFVVRRAGGGVGGNAVEVDANSDRCTIRKGSIGEASIGGGATFAFGIYAVGKAGTLEGLTVTSCSNTGLFTGAMGWVVKSCGAHDNLGAGMSFSVGTTVSDCTAIDNSGAWGIGVGLNSTVTNCVVRGQKSNAGINAGGASTLLNCSVTGGTSTGIQAGFSSTLQNCAATSNTDGGISVSGGATLENCTASLNTHYGIRATSGGVILTGCTANSNTSSVASSFGIDVGPNSLVTDCTANDNTSSNGSPTGTTGGGISAGTASTVRNCVVAKNKGDGIRLSESGQLIGNTASDNGYQTGDGAGIRVTGQKCRIDGNHVVDNDRGIEVTATRNLIVRNSARSNTLNYVIVAGNRTAQIVVPGLNAADITGANSGSSDGFTAVDPWANFTF